MRRAIIAVALLLIVGAAQAATETQSGADASGLIYTKLKTASVPAPFMFWCWSIIPASPEGAANATRFKTHHDMRVPDTSAGTYIPIARIDLLHTNAAATDSITMYVYNKAVKDSLIWISAVGGQVSFPVYGDSVSFKAGCTSGAGDWIAATYFER
jgi:hypothetical protein